MRKHASRSCSVGPVGIRFSAAGALAGFLNCGGAVSCSRSLSLSSAPVLRLASISAISVGLVGYHDPVTTKGTTSLFPDRSLHIVMS
uniref:Uncharacterized protein n=1 Tax=Setaria italica TaxID=4555 RepID=K4AL31_SETIT